jgi:hypothetical protein
MILALVRSTAIPLPTLTAKSGRGMYLFYLFSFPLRCTPEAMQLRKRALDELLGRLECVAADYSSTNVVQPFKAPGSRCDIGKVQYAMFERGLVTAPRYSLDALAEFLGVRDPASIVQAQGLRRKRSRGGASRPLRYVAWAFVRMNELERLVPRRARWEGCRHYLLLAYAEAASWLYRARHGVSSGRELAFEETLRFNLSLPDPEDEAVIRSEIFGSRLRARPQKNETIVRCLAITVEESHRARLSSLAHPDVVREREEAKQKRRDKKKARRSEIDERLLSGESVSSIAHTVGMSRETIYRRKRELSRT